MFTLLRPRNASRGRLVSRIAVVVVPILGVSSVQQPVFAVPEAAGHRVPAVVPDKPVKTRALAAKPRTVRADSPAVQKEAVWPARADVEIDLPDHARVASTVGGLPVTVQAVTLRGATQSADATLSRIRLRVLDREAASRAGAQGPVVAVGRADDGRTVGKVQLEIGYAAVASAFGGDYGARLRLVQLPACALTTPERADCRIAAPVATSVNDSGARTLTATVDAGASAMTVLAAEAGEASSQGDYAATSLAPSSKWNMSLASGGFTWSYALRTPKTPGGNAPQITFGYSSQAVDGRNASTNNQGSWVGEGFGYEPGYIERRYKACADDGHGGVGDQCWAFHNATIMLAGMSGELVKVNSSLYKLAKDDGTKIERLTGAVNGDDNGEYWRATTPEGTQYFFGLNRLPGWGQGKEETNSAWTTPVSSDDTGEPCYNSSGWTDSFCDEGWRWNLDYVKDTHGNVISYYYGKELNNYAKAAKTDVNGSPYVRGGWLARIDYGQVDGAVYTTNAPARVQFETKERCLATGSITCAESELNDSTAYAWADVPWDRNCVTGTHCKITQASASFWTRKRLTAITTEIRAGTGWTPVERWDLRHSFRDNGDGSQTLWLDKIDHTGLHGATVTTPSIELIGIQMSNRIDSATDNLAPLNRYRLSTIYTETGGQVQINYTPTDCEPGATPAEGASTKRCYPVKWNPFGTPDPLTDWFHKYLVAQIIEIDRTGGNPDMVSDYEYSDAGGTQDPINAAAWRKPPADGISKDEYRTWSIWRGYPKVTVRRGDIQSLTTRVDHLFFRGMDGDDQPGSSNPRSVKVTDSTGAVHTDADELAGMELETTVYNGSAVVSKQINTPKMWTTHTQTETWGTRTSVMVKPETSHAFAALTPDAQGNPTWRETKTTTTYDTTWGRATQIEDLGDTSTAADDRCTKISYIENPNLYMYTYRKLTETFSVNCGTQSPNRATQLLASDRIAYDGQAYDVAPTKGSATRQDKLDTDNGTTTTYLTTTTTVDSFGRPLRVTDPRGYYADRSYTDVNGLTVQEKVTSYPTATLGYFTTVDYSPAYAVRTGQTDPNNYRQDFEYDGLGRLVKAWTPIRPKSLNYLPDIKYTYTVRSDKPTVVKSEAIRNDSTYRVSYELFDSYLRGRQKQVEGPGGWLLTDTIKNPIGKDAVSNAAYLATGTPGDLVLVVPEGNVNGQAKHLYDGAERVSAEITSVAGDEKWRTTYSYSGDRTNVDPPTGGTPTTTVVDARGNRTALYQYKGSSPTGDADVSTYTYTPANLLAGATGPDDVTWRYTYFQNGLKKTSEDPDAGTTSFTYDKNANLTSTTDARGTTLSFVYDRLNRITERWLGQVTTGVKQAIWAYDTIYKGQLTGSGRYVSANIYYVTYPQRDQLYRPLKTRYIIPADAGTELAKTYDFGTSYNVDGTVQSLGTPAGGDLAAENLTLGYDTLERPITLTGANTLVTSTTYSSVGQIQELKLSTGGPWALQKLAYERGTGRLTGVRIDRQNAPIVDMDNTYQYDAAGNVLSITDTPAGAERDIQCFTYDGLRRLTEAWSTENNAVDPCAGGDVAISGVSGVAPYHHRWTFLASGNRDTETIHSTDGGSDTTRTYHYPAEGAAQPHTLRTIDQTTGGTTTQFSYSYDPAGNTLSHGPTTTPQALTWDGEGHLATSTPQGGQATKYVFDADGNRLVRKEPNATTIYIGNMELRLDLTSRQVTATRFYSFAGSPVAVRTGAGVDFQFSDHHNTSNAVINATTGAITWRRTTPYGTVRGDVPSTWPDQKGFVGGTLDTTSGLTHIGAREYDPTLGRFVSIDPVFDLNEPQTWNGYAYANNTPVTAADPDGRHMPSQMDQGPSNLAGLYEIAYKGTDYCGDLHPAKCFEKFRLQFSDHFGIETTMAKLRAEYDKAGDEGMLILSFVPYLNVMVTIVEAVECAKDITTACVAETIISAVPVLGGLNKFRKIETIADVADEVRDAKKAAAGGIGCVVPSHSFDPETPVLMADGTTKPIKDIKIGDEVLATDPKTGKTEAKPVSALHSNADRDLADVAIADAGTVESKVLHTTWHHPFWNATTGEWTDAKDLKVGDRLRGADGEAIQVVKAVKAVKVWAGLSWMRDLTVDDIHTYYVLAGDTPVLVHNTGGMDGCSDAAYQGVLHIRDEIAREGAGGSHSWAAGMSDDQLADYLDGFVTRGGGQPLKDGAVGWYDTDRGVAIIQRGEYSMTGYEMSYEDFRGKLK